MTVLDSYAIAMRVAVALFLPLALFASDPILLQVDDKHKPPPTDEARQFLAMVCPASRIAKDEYDPGLLACRVCPSWTDLDAGGMALQAIHYGHFTAPDADQALVATLGCEPHSLNWGASLLFTSHDGKWRFNRYLRGVITDNCTTLQRSDGRTTLVCSRHEGHQSVIARMLYTIDLLRPKDSIEVAALTLTDTVPTCGFNYASATDTRIHPLQKAEFRKISLDPGTGEVHAEVEFGIRKITEAQAKECADLRFHRPIPKTTEPQTKLYDIQFHFDGERLLPSTESAANVRIVEDQSVVP